MTLAVRTRLSVMMFLQFFVWGVWYVTMGTYLGAIGFKGSDIGKAYSIMAWAGIFSPFFVGMVADRFFPGQKVLGVMHILGAVAMYFTAGIQTPGTFFMVLFLYALCYMSTLALVNAISFHQMQDPGKEFPGIRVLGTIGWIVAGGTLSLLEWLIPSHFDGIEASNIPMKLAAICSLLLGLYSFTLPNTPPKGAGHKVTFGDIIGVKALKLMREPAFAVFVISSLLICIPLSFYYSFANPFLNQAGMTHVAFKMTLGQMSEIIFMLIMPLFFVRLGVKRMLLVGMLAWVVRYFLFATGNNQTMVWMLYGGILLHGICFDFFFVTGQIYVDKKAPLEIRANAQGLIALVTYGVGMVIGANIAGWVVDHYTSANGALWQKIWLVPALMALAVALLFAVFFRDKLQTQEASFKKEPVPLEAGAAAKN